MRLPVALEAPMSRPFPLSPCSLALAAVLFGGCAPNAGGESTATEAASATEFDSAADLFADAYGLSRAAAVERATAEDALGTLVTRLDPDTLSGFAGAWIEEDATGTIHILLMDPTPAKEAVLSAMFPADHPLVIERARYSLAELETWADAIPDDTPGINSLGIDEETNVIRVGARPGEVASVTAQLQSALPPDAFAVVEEAEVAQAGSCKNRNECGHPLRGGIFVSSNNGAGDLRTCSLGFMGVADNGDHWGLTAAHCAVSGAIFKINSDDEPVYPYIGGAKRRQLGGTLDMEGIKIEGPWVHDKLGYLYLTKSHKRDEVDFVYSPSDVHKGMFLCRGGAHTGQRCGNVLYAKRRMKERLADGTIVTLHKQVVSKGCFLPGDSGGPIYSLSSYSIGAVVITIVRAVGIATASNWTDPDKCPKNPWYFGSYVSEFRRLHNVRVKTR